VSETCHAGSLSAVALVLVVLELVVLLGFPGPASLARSHRARSGDGWCCPHWFFEGGG